MPWKHALSSLAVTPLILSIFFVQQLVPILNRIFLQCSTRRLSLGNKVSFPGQSAYNATIRSYWSQQAQQVSPACVVRPQSSEHVATAVRELTIVAHIVRVVGGRQCQFAIRGGGRTPWAESANIEGGVTLDLGAMRDVSVNSERNVTSVGGGARWIDVCAKLDAMSLAVSGGRVSDIGVAGLILGGKNCLSCIFIIRLLVSVSLMSVKNHESSLPRRWRPLEKCYISTLLLNVSVT